MTRTNVTPTLTCTFREVVEPGRVVARQGTHIPVCDFRITRGGGEGGGAIYACSSIQMRASLCQMLKNVIGIVRGLMCSRVYTFVITGDR
jgi:hypothetical protein